MAGLAQTLARCRDRRHAEALTVVAQIRPTHPRHTSRRRYSYYSVYLYPAGDRRTWEVAMAMQRDFLLLATLVVAVATPAFGQTAPPAVVPTQSAAPGGASVPDFSGVWRHGSLPWLVPPASGPGPVTNRSRTPDTGVSNYSQLVGDYTNPILQP